MSYRDKYSFSEWRTLELAPVWMFTMVAAMDKKIDKKEMKEFAEQIVNAPRHSEAFGLELFRSIHSDLSELLDEAGQKNPLQGLREVSELLGRLDQKQADDYKATLLLIGSKVAQSSGGFLKKSKVSKGEATALVLAAAILKGKA